ncbi:MAG TPA: ribosome biogenesis GTP-binding protein YihA/YsxC [Candidatus Sulfomarinibacteraceae bacterium]|nr:ribosome biogenesis GTP-binding protein YihA/YsxC [Candidatus Sulfomarinibacteraceae bacterium]
MEIREVSFRGSALKRSDRPQEWFPHVAVAGRSNVGKSSLLNWLLGRSLARVAKAPGKTRTLNFYLINRSFFLVDLPGYGFAKVGRELREEWGRELGRYLADDDRLAGVMTLVDIRHGPTPLDLDLQELLVGHGRERLVVLTKADKVGRGHRAEMQREVQLALGLPRPPMAVSVTTGEGRAELLGRMDELLAQWRSR